MSTTNFPASLDDSSSLPNPTATGKTNSPSHSALHTTENDAIKALEGKVGTGSTTPTANTLLRGTGTGTTAWGPLTSAQLASTISDETGSGSLVFGTSPTLVTPAVDTINESTPSHGVTVGGVNLKSGALNTNNSVVTSNITDGAATRPKIGWSTFSNNIKSATNGSAPTLTNTSQDLASCGLSLSFTCSGAAYALVTVSLGISSTTDFEFRPEIRLGGTVQSTYTPAAAAGNASSRATVRGFTCLVTLANGSNTLSAGVNLSASTSPALIIGGGTIAAIVFGNVTA